MTVIVQKPEFNLREKLSELEFGTLPYEKAPSGSVIQYVEASHKRMTNRFSTSSTSYTATNYDLTISPRLFNSKILIYANLSSHANNNEYIYVKVFNVTANRYVRFNDGVGNDGMYESAAGGDSQWMMLPIEAVDIPDSTSPQTYRLYIRVSSGGTAYAGWSSSAANTMNMNFMSATEYKQ